MKKQHLIYSGIVGIIIVVLIVAILLLNGSNVISDDEKFIGKWKLIDTSYEPMRDTLDSTDTIYEFFENGTIKDSEIHYNDPNDKSDTYIHINWMNWNISNGKLLMGNETGMYIYYDYQFSNNNEELKITIPQYMWMQFKRN